MLHAGVGSENGDEVIEGSFTGIVDGQRIGDMCDTFVLTPKPHEPQEKTMQRQEEVRSQDSPVISAVRVFVEAINRHDAAAISALMSEDHTFVDSGGTIEFGRETMAAGWQDYFRMFPDYEVHIDRLLADESLVAAFGSASGTYNGKRGLVAKNKITMPAAWMAVVEDGKIKHWQVYADWSEGLKVFEEDEKSGQ